MLLPSGGNATFAGATCILNPSIQIRTADVADVAGMVC